MPIDWDFTPVWRFTPESAWKNDKGLGSWAFTKQPNKPSYNEGDHIATYANPVWSMEEGSNVPITPTHQPCGYWTKDYVPSPPPVPNLIFQVETQTSGAGDISIIVKKSYNDLSELSSLSMGSVLWTGVYKSPDIKYGNDYWIAATPTFSAVGGNHSDIIIQKVLTDLSVAWNVTIDISYIAGNVRQSTKLALDLSGGFGYVSLGTSGLYNGNRFLIYKFALADGSNSSFYDSGTFGNTCIYDLAYYSGNVYFLGQKRGGFGDGKLNLIKLNSSGVVDWTVVTGSSDCAGAGLYIDGSGIYIAYSNRLALPFLWWIEKYDFGGIQQWAKSQNYSPQIPYKIVGDDNYIYVLGGGTNFICDVRDKNDGTQKLTRSWYTAASAYCAINPIGSRLDIGGRSGGYAVRNDGILITDLSTSKTAAGVRRAAWGMAYDL